jgi:hypothetical protein
MSTPYTKAIAEARLELERARQHLAAGRVQEAAIALERANRYAELANLALDSETGKAAETETTWHSGNANASIVIRYFARGGTA